MSKHRDDYGQFAKPRSTGFIALMWFCSLLCLGILLAAGRAVLADFASFRSCNSNSAGLVVKNCGKNSINVGDLMLIGLFILAAALALSVFTATSRATRSRKKT